jgi:hypothetical protein
MYLKQLFKQVFTWRDLTPSLTPLGMWQKGGEGVRLVRRSGSCDRIGLIFMGNIA